MLTDIYNNSTFLKLFQRNVVISVISQCKTWIPDAKLSDHTLSI